MRTLVVSTIAALAASLFAAVPAASAGRGDRVIVRGACSGASTWKLKLKHEDGRIEAEFEVDQNRVGRRWRVVLRRNGAVVLRTTRVTRAPSGSFEARRLLANAAGPDRVVAVARARATGEVCRGVATL
jgi:hypothetical protein